MKQLRNITLGTWLSIAYFIIVGGIALYLLPLLVTDNEVVGHFGMRDTLVMVVAAVLAVAVVFLPLLIVAAVLQHRRQASEHCAPGQPDSA